MSVLNLVETQNFGEWLEKINELIKNINSLQTGESSIDSILDEAKELGQIGQYLPSVKSRDYNVYTHNAIAYIDENGMNGPVNNVAFVLYSAATSKGQVTHLAISVEKNKVRIYIRSKKGTTSSWNKWTLLLSKEEADTTFFPITGGTITGNTQIDGTLTLTDTLISNKEALYYDGLRLCSELYGAIMKIDNAETSICVTYQNDPLGIATLQKPIVIDNYTGIANINGTSEYANYLHECGLSQDFENADSTLAASALSVSELNKKLTNEYMPLTGGSFTGIVEHNADITLGWTHRDGVDWNSPITIYSPTEIIFRPTNSMCMVSHDSGADFYLDRDNEPVIQGMPCTVCARTRSGIVNHNPGDVVYELGALEITEDSVGLRLRKRNVSLDNPIDVKKNMALMFTRESFSPTNDDTISLGSASLRFSQVFASTSTISTSDENMKADIQDIDTDLLDNWKNIQWKSFKFNDAIESKGEENARIHTGLIAQDILKVVDSVDIHKYGFFCHDEWDEQTDTDYITIPEKRDSSGNIIQEASKKAVTRVTKKAGNQYSLRYQEVQAIENAYLRREIEKLKTEIKNLKAILDINEN